MSMLTVSISDMKFSTDPGDIIVTYSLGSCIGITAYDPDKRMGGMVHCLLPSSVNARERARKRPFMFVDTGVAGMVRTLIDLGARKHRLVFKVAGGANMRNDDFFSTGKRNLAALDALFEKNGVVAEARAVGGTIPRSMFLHLATGRVVVRSLGKESDL